MRQLIRFLFPLLLVCIWVGEAKADPLVITGGSAMIQAPTTSALASIAFSTSAFSVSGYGDRNSGRAMGCSTCAPGEMAANYAIRGNDFFVGQLSMGGGPAVSAHFYNLNLGFTTAPIVLPTASVGTLIVTTPFVMTGTMTCYAGGQELTPMLLSTQLSGQGIATLTYYVSQYQGQMSYILQSVRYDFSSAPVPEPTTILLLGSGLVGIALRRRRRRLSKLH